MQKVLELKPVDWVKGISSQPNLPLGGLFQKFNGCDPFEQGGLALPSTIPAHQTVGTTPEFITSWYDGSNQQLYVHTNSKLYQVLQNAPYTVVDVTAQINTTSMSGALSSIGGVIVWQGKYIYCSLDNDNNAYIAANQFAVDSADDVLLHTVNNVDLDFVPFCIGPDGNLYYGGDGFIGEITSVTGTSGNASTYNIDPGYRVRDITTDGRYLIIVADNNTAPTANRIVGDCKCKVYFWDLTSTAGGGAFISPAVTWELKDSYIIAAKFLENAVYLFTYNGMYICNISTSPKMLRVWPSDITILARPNNPASVAVKNGSLFWCNSQSTVYLYIYAYGNPITGQPKIFYQPYINDELNFSNTCLAIVGDNLFMGTTQPGLCFFNVGTTRGQVSVTSLNTTMLMPFTYGFTKVALAQPLAAGQTVALAITSQNGNNVITSETKSYNSVRPQQTLKFIRVPSANQHEKFEDLVLAITSSVAIQRISVYATPTNDSNEDL
jgi:hypothetical protein